MVSSGVITVRTVRISTKDPWVVESMKQYEQRVSAIRDEETPALIGVGATVELSEGEQLMCPACSLVLTNASEFSRHMKQNHPNEVPKGDTRMGLRGKSKYGLSAGNQ